MQDLVGLGQGIEHGRIILGLEIIDSLDQSSSVGSDGLCISHFCIKGEQTGLISGPHFVDVGFGSRFGSRQLAGVVHAAGDIHYKQGG